MKRFIVLAFALLTLSARLPAQSNAISGNLNASTTTCLVSNSCLVLTVPASAGGATIKLSGTFSATVQFEASADLLSTALADANWVALLATPSNSSTAASSATSTGVWQVNVSGYTRIRIRVSTYASGTVAGAINTSTASARGGAGGGGGGGGAVASCTTAGGVAYENGTANTLTCDGNFLWDSTNIRSVFGLPSASFAQSLRTTLSGSSDGVYSFRALNPVSRASVVFGAGQTDFSNSAGLIGVGGELEAVNVGAIADVSLSALVGTALAKGGNLTGDSTLDVVSGVSGIESGSTSLVNAFGAQMQVINLGSGTITKGASFFAVAPLNAGGGAITNAYGFYAQSFAGIGTHNYGLYTEDFGAGANDYAIYSAGGKVFFGGTAQAGQGTAGTPGYGFASANGGFFWDGAICATISGTPSWCSLDTHAIQASNTQVYAFCPGSADTPSANCLTGISQDSNGVIDVGNGTQGNTSGTVQATKFSAISDGVHNGEVSLLCQTTNATLPANTVSLLGCTAASNTAWGITLPTAEPGSGCAVQLGTAASHYSAMTCSNTFSGGLTAPSFTSNNTSAGFIDLPQGTTSAAVSPCNAATSICIQAPTSVTSYLENLPGSAATGFRFGTNAANVVTDSTITMAAGTMPAATSASAVAFTVTPVLGVAGTSNGTLTLSSSGNASGLTVLTPGAATSTVNMTYPIVSGTICASGSACSATTLTSTVALGTPPIAVTSATPVANLQPAFLRATMTADWTCGTGGTVSACTSATIVGSTGVPMTITLPSSALSWDFDCDGVVGSATGDPANNWNLITATNAPTNTMASYSMGTAAAVGAFGATTGNSSTTTFNIGGTWTLGAIGTKMPFHIHARIEGASASGTVVSLQVVDPTVADLLTIYRGMSCWAHQ